MGISREVVDETLILENSENGESIEIHEKVSDGCMLIAPRGELTESVAHDLEDELTSAALVCHNVVIDMSGVSGISNSVIRMMLEVQHIVDSVDGEFTLRGLNSQVMDRFREMGLEAVFDIEDNDIGV